MRYQLYITVTLLLSAGSALAQSGIFTFPLESDNKQARIHCLYKDNNGYLLVGSDKGLFRFDGEEYKIIPFPNKEYTDTVTAIFQDHTGRIWTGFRNGKIGFVDRNLLQYDHPEEGTPQKPITAFAEDRENKRWFSTAGEGLYYVGNNHLYLINDQDGLSDLNINCLAVSARGDIIAGSDQGLQICSVAGGKKQVRHIGTQNGLPDYLVTAICPAGSDRFWIGMQDRGVCLYDHNTGRITVPEPVKNWPYGQVNALLPSQGKLLIGTRDKGLYSISISDPVSGNPEIIQQGLHISSLVADNQGNTWVASLEKGLSRDPGEFITIRKIPGNDAFEHLHSLLCDAKGNVWLNNTSNEIIRVSGADSKTTRYQLKGVNEKTDITSLFEDVNGLIWIGTMGRGLFILDPSTGQHRPFREFEPFTSAGILSISGRNNHIYVSSLEGSVSIDINRENKTLSAPFVFRPFDSRNIGTNYVYSILEDSRGRVWFATDGNGLTLMKDGSFTYFNEKNKLADDHIYSITEDRQGHTWFSTATAGIYQYDGTTFRNYGIREGLSDLKISVLKTIRSGHIVVVHRKGLDILNPVTGKFTYVDNRQGLGNINVEDLGAVALDTAGNIIVSSDKGLVTWRQPPYAMEKPKTIIESVQLFLNDIDTSVHRFRYDENHFTFQFNGLYYSDPARVTYEYMLEGLDSGWVFTSDQSKSFPKLQPGKYRFRVRTSLNRNMSGTNEAAFSFYIDKPFYKKTWFMAIMAMLALVLLYGYIKARERSFKRMERLRRDKIENRFEVLRTQVNPHFLFNSFNTLISTIEEDPKTAVEYAGHLSDFFRDIVNYRDKDTIPLAEEIGLLKNYYQLQLKRYGQPLQLVISLDEEQMKPYSIPPLTLQLLMENAIKHNTVSKDKPLRITVGFGKNETLYIANNINPRVSKQAGAGMGLQNIMNRYNLLTHKKVEIQQNGDSFIVSLPLIRI